MDWKYKTDFMNRMINRHCGKAKCISSSWNRYRSIFAYANIIDCQCRIMENIVELNTRGTQKSHRDHRSGCAEISKGAIKWLCDAENCQSTIDRAPTYSGEWLITIFNQDVRVHSIQFKTSPTALIVSAVLSPLI